MRSRNVVLVWQPAFVPCPVPDRSVWIYKILWKGIDDNSDLSTDDRCFLYIIEDKVKKLPYYAGQTQNLHNRFNDYRARVLREFRLVSSSKNPISNLILRVAIIKGTNLDIAERWLVRTLYKDDVANKRNLLQNNDKLIKQYIQDVDTTIENKAFNGEQNCMPTYLKELYSYKAKQVV